MVEIESLEDYEASPRGNPYHHTIEIYARKDGTPSCKGIITSRDHRDEKRRSMIPGKNLNELAKKVVCSLAKWEFLEIPERIKQIEIKLNGFQEPGYRNLSDTELTGFRRSLGYHISKIK